MRTSSTFGEGDIDHAGRFAFNSVFGDKVIGCRTTAIHAHFAYGIPETDVVVTETGSGTATVVDSSLIVSSGAATSSSAVIESKEVIQYIPGDEMYAFFTAAFPTEGVTGNECYIGFESPENGFRIGFKDDVFGISYYRDSVLESFYSKDQFNINKIPDVDFSKYNIFRIGLGYLGIAPIIFEVYSDIEKGWIPFHFIAKSNRQNKSNLSNPTLRIVAKSENTTNDTDVSFRSASWRAGTISSPQSTGVGRYFSARGSRVAITDSPVLTISNKTSFKGKTNYAPLTLVSISAASDGNKPFTLSLIKDGTLGGTPVFVDVNANSSVTQTDTSASSLTGGVFEHELALGKSDSFMHNLCADNIKIYPGETLTVNAVTSSAGDITVALRWKELF